MAPVCVIDPVSETSVMLPGTIVAAIVMAPAFWNARLPLAPVKVNVAPGRLFAWVDRSMLPAEVKLLAGAASTPLSVMPPDDAVAASVPPTVEAPKIKLAVAIAALPAAFSDTGPLNALVEVARLMFAAELKLLPAVSVRTPLCVILPAVEVANNAPPTPEVPRFKLAELIDAVPVPVVFSETGPVKSLACVPRLMFWLAI